MTQRESPKKDAIDINTLKIAVVGAGSWGTAIADLLGSKGFQVDLWAFEEAVKQGILTNRRNPYFLPDITLSENIHPSNDLMEVVTGKDLLVIVVPSHVMRKVAEEMLVI